MFGVALIRFRHCIASDPRARTHCIASDPRARALLGEFRQKLPIEIDGEVPELSFELEVVGKTFQNIIDGARHCGYYTKIPSAASVHGERRTSPENGEKNLNFIEPFTARSP